MSRSQLYFTHCIHISLEMWYVIIIFEKMKKYLSFSISINVAIKINKNGGATLTAGVTKIGLSSKKFWKQSHLSGQFHNYKFISFKNNTLLPDFFATMHKGVKKSANFLLKTLATGIGCSITISKSWAVFALERTQACTWKHTCVHTQRYHYTD